MTEEYTPQEKFLLSLSNPDLEEFGFGESPTEVIPPSVQRSMEMQRIISSNPNWNSKFVGSPVLELVLENCLDNLLAAQSDELRFAKANPGGTEVDIKDDLGNSKSVSFKSAFIIPESSKKAIKQILEDLVDIFGHLHKELIRSTHKQISNSLSAQVKSLKRQVRQFQVEEHPYYNQDSPQDLRAYPKGELNKFHRFEFEIIPDLEAAFQRSARWSYWSTLCDCRIAARQARRNSKKSQDG